MSFYLHTFLFRSSLSLISICICLSLFGSGAGVAVADDADEEDTVRGLCGAAVGFGTAETAGAVRGGAAGVCGCS